MGRVLVFIKKSNQVLFFIAAILFIIFMSIDIVSDLFRNKYEPPKIELVDSSDPDSTVKKPVYSVNFLTRLKDTHIFELSSKVIDTSQTHNSEVYGMFSSAEISYDLSGGSYLSRNAVNLMFVKENGKRSILLKQDGLVIEFSRSTLEPREGSYRLDKNLYLIIDEDSNQNGYLDHDDSTKLFTSTYDGKDLTHVLSDVGSFRLIDNNKLIISKKGNSPSFFTFNVSDSTLLNLNTAIDVNR